MYRLATCIWLSAALLAVTVAAAVNMDSRNRASTDAGRVYVVVHGFTGSAKAGFGPTLAVLLYNSGPQPVHILRFIGGGLDGPHSPLGPRIVDAATGKPVPGKHIYKFVKPRFQENDFLELDPGYCHGPVVDLREWFTLCRGKKYRVRFTYTSYAPRRVGRIVPWQGTPTSTEVTVVIP